ncbi:unnamed protein product [Protopolystoma xenopodis]|uniref:Uncharacterized protein n=1 Tax=Protopolystoma xenopodis TaxID=117903 RepID=A0A448WXX5_9PLAT|nr:unnamed protein product [Protopolystoma xenopodis]
MGANVPSVRLICQPPLSARLITLQLGLIGQVGRSAGRPAAKQNQISEFAGPDPIRQFHTLDDGPEGHAVNRLVEAATDTSNPSPWPDRLLDLDPRG